MKNKLKWYLRSGILYFGIPFLLWNCESENADSPEGQQNHIETVAVNEAIDFFNVKTAADPAKPGSETYVTPHLGHIAQEEISNSDALLTIIPATTIHSAYYSRILLLKINNKIQSIVFSMYASGASTQEHFSGEIIITDLNGNFLNGYRVVNGIFVSQFRKNSTSDKSSAIAKSTGAVCPDHGECVEGSNCIVCLQELEEVVVIGDSGNNGGPTPFIDLNDFPGIDEGGGGGPDMGMGWGYGPGDGVAPEEENVEDQVVIDTTFANTPCLMAVYEQMGGATTFENYLKNFDGSFSVADLRFSADDSFKSNRETKYHNAMAITDPPLVSNLINITFNTDSQLNSNILTKPDVYKAVAMIHEILHAEMYRKMLDAVIAAEINQTTLDWANNWTSEEFYNNYLNSLENRYFGIFDYFTRYNYGIPTNDNPNDWQHQQMAQHYRDVVKQALTDYDPALTEAEKEALSWLGLKSADIVAWQNLTPEERTAINNLQTQIKNTFPNGCN